MTDLDLKNIIRLRWAVYRLGASSGCWHQLSEEDVKGFMDFIFPKSKHLAYYNLMVNEVLNSEVTKEFPVGTYNLFKFPEQEEEKIIDYLKRHLYDDSSKYDSNPLDCIESLATIVSEGALYPTSVGSLDQIGLTDMTKILAYRYRLAFINNNNSFPYFE